MAKLAPITITKERDLKSLAVEQLDKIAKRYIAPGFYVRAEPRGFDENDQRRANALYLCQDYTRPNGDRNTLSLGAWPSVKLEDAKLKREENLKLLRDGTDPGENRKKQRQEAKLISAREQVVNKAIRDGEAAPDSLEAVAREFHKWKSVPLPAATVHGQNKQVLWAKGHSDCYLSRMVTYVFPRIGTKHIAEITEDDVIPILHAVERMGKTPTAKLIYGNLNSMFAWAKTRRVGGLKRNPLRDIELKEVLAKTIKVPRPALTEVEKFGDFLAAVDTLKPPFGKRYSSTKAALKLQAIFYQRSTNVVQMRWEHLDLDAAEWVIPSVEMKGTADAKANRPDHWIPLPTQAVQYLRELKEQYSDGSEWVFPNRYDGKGKVPHMGRSTLLKAIYRLGYKGEMSAHGFRAAATTIGAEELEFENGIMHAQMRHVYEGPNGDSYMRAEYRKRRREMLQQWADYLDAITSDAKRRALKLAA